MFACGPKHPFADWDNKPRVFGNGYKLGWRNGAISWMIANEATPPTLEFDQLQYRPAADRRDGAHFFAKHNANGSPEPDDQMLCHPCMAHTFEKKPVVVRLP